MCFFVHSDPMINNQLLLPYHLLVGIEKKKMTAINTNLDYHCIPISQLFTIQHSEFDL